MKTKLFLKTVILIGVLAFVATLGIVTAAQATPSIGVGTGGYITGCTAANYWECFNGPYVSGADVEGFSITGSPVDITVFTNISGADIWLLTEQSVWDATTNIQFTYDSTTLSFAPVTTSSSFDGYELDYYGVNLGPVDADWYTLDSPPFNPKPFYGLDGVLTFTGSMPFGSYFFAVADDNEITGLQGDGMSLRGYGPDSFSPKTTSAVGVPEPSTLSMLVAGGALFILGMFIRKRFASLS